MWESRKVSVFDSAFLSTMFCSVPGVNLTVYMSTCAHVYLVCAYVLMYAFVGAAVYDFNFAKYPQYIDRKAS